MGQQGIPAIKHMCDRTELMLPQSDIRVHSHEMDMGSVVLPGTGGIEKLIVFLHQLFPALRILPHPVPEGILDGLLFLLGQRCFLFVQDTALLSFRILHRIVDPDILQVQRFLQDLIGIGPVGAVGHVSSHIIVAGIGLAVDPPLRGIGGIFHLNGSPQIIGHFKGLLHELLDDIRVQPGCPQPHIDLRGIQVFGLGLLQRCDIDPEEGITLRSDPRQLQLVPDFTRQIFIRCLPAFVDLHFCHWIFENDSLQLRNDLSVLSGSTKKLRHIGKIHPAFLPDGDSKGFTGRVHTGDLPLRTYGSFREHIRLALQLAVFIDILQ